MEPVKNRLLGVTILGWLFILFSVSGLLWMVPYLVVKGLSTSVILVFAWNIFQLVVGIAVLKLRRWARKAAIAAAVISTLIFGCDYISGYVEGYSEYIQPDLGALILGYAIGFGPGIVITGIIAYYLMRSKVREEFK